MDLAQTLDLAAVVVFALTGALTASRAQLDIVGFIFLACLTAVGGGTLRDLLLDRNPVFWIGAPSYILAAAGAAVVIFFTAHLVESRLRWLLWLDAAALAVAVPAGVAAAIETDQPGVIIVVMGVITGTFGGMMRDVVANELPFVLRQGELYVTAAFAGASAGLGALQFDLAGETALIVTGIVTFALRAGSLGLGWKLAPYRPRPPRNQPPRT